MTKYVAFLRAINVGGHVVKMDFLRRQFEAMNFSDVETFIASGNVIFESRSKSIKALEKKIAEHLHQALGYEATTFVRSMPQIISVARYQPFPEEELKAPGSSLYVAFLSDVPSEQAKQAVLALETQVDAFHFSGQELYWLCRKKISESEVSGPALGRALTVQATTRNVTTVRRIAAKFGTATK